MAEQETNISRRSALGVISIAPLALGVPGATAAPRADTRRWRALVRDYDRKRARFERIEREVAPYMNAPREQELPDWVDPLMTPAVAAMQDAEMHLLAEVPAPDTTALIWKIEHLLVEEDDFPINVTPATTRAVLADTRRLLG